MKTYYNLFFDNFVPVKKEKKFQSVFETFEALCQCVATFSPLWCSFFET